MGEVADSNLVLLFDGGEEWPLVVDAEGEDTVLIGGHELGTKNSAGVGAADGLKTQTVEGREHGELKLELVVAGDFKWNPLVVDILGDLNGVHLLE